MVFGFAGAGSVGTVAVSIGAEACTGALSSFSAGMLSAPVAEPSGFDSAAVMSSHDSVSDVTSAE